MAVKLDGLSPKELKAVIEDANSRMTAARASQIDAVRKKFDAILKSESLQLSDVYPARGGKPGKRPGGGVPKYRNPADPAQTWTGNGKRPAWFIAALKKSGVTEQTLAIAKPPAKKVTPAKKKAGKKSAPKGK